MPGAQVIGVASFLPERVVPNMHEATGDAPGSAFMRGIREKRFASPEYTTLELGARALERVLAQTNVNASELDLLVCSGFLDDILGTGMASGLPKRIAGLTNAAIVNVNTNCTSFLSALGVARAYIEAGLAKRVACVIATNFVSRMPETYRDSPSGGPLGDGAAAMLLAAGDRSILATHESVVGAQYGLLRVQPLTTSGEEKPYWMGSAEGLVVRFTTDMLELLIATAIREVPKTVRAALQKAELTTDDVSLLVTHQPNRFLIDEWRRRLKIVPPRAHDTVATYGNLFQASIPVTLADAVEKNMLAKGDIVALGTFANAGDHFAAAVIRW